MIGYLLINIIFWLLHLVDIMLMQLSFMRSATDSFNAMINYLDLLVLYIRPLFPYTVSLIFSTLSNLFAVYMIIIFIGLVKRFIPFFGSSKTLN